METDDTFLSLLDATLRAIDGLQPGRLRTETNNSDADERRACEQRQNKREDDNGRRSGHEALHVATGNSS